MEQGRPKKPKKARYDLREFWPWYQRSWHTKGGWATPPPFTLEDVSNEPKLLPRRQRRVAQMLCIVVALALVIVVIWGFFH